MKFIPAIDLKDNKCVRLKKGKEENLTIFNDDPVEQANYFEKQGCQRIHIVDLDGAFGRSNVNKETILEIRKKINIPIQLGGGINDEATASYWVEKGINYLILGSMAIKKKEDTVTIINKFPNQIYIALDVLENKIMIKGWVESSNLFLDFVINDYLAYPIKGYILTDISRDGMLGGLNFSLIKDLTWKTRKNIIVGGGLSNYDDLNELNKIKCNNLEGVIAGKSFYSGKIKINKALNILDKNA